MLKRRAGGGSYLIAYGWHVCLVPPRAPAPGSPIHLPRGSARIQARRLCAGFPSFFFFGGGGGERGRVYIAL